MEIQVDLELAPPGDAGELDQLARAGVAAMLAEQLDRLADERTDETELVDHAISVHPMGAQVVLVLDVDAEHDPTSGAENAGGELLATALAQCEPLTGWRMAVSQASIPADTDTDTADDTDEELKDSDTADTADTADANDTAALAEALADELSDLADIADDPDTLRDQLLAAAGRLHAFGLDAFGYQADAEESPITEYQAQLVAGALVQGLEVLTDQLFEDVETLRQAHATAADRADLAVLDELPEHLAEAYDPLFAQQFLLVSVILGYRLSQPEWTPPLCAAEALALHIVKGKAADQLGMAEADEELPLDVMFAVFDEYAFEDSLHEELFDAREHDDAGEVAGWFLPYAHLTAALHPYLDLGEEPLE